MKSQVKIGDNRLEMVRVFEAPRQRVFAAWKHAEQVQRWWGCEGTTEVRSEMDFRKGGSFTHRIHVEGCGEMTYAGVYEEIVEPARIVWRTEFGGVEARVSVEFVAQGNQTRLILIQEGFGGRELCKIVSDGFAASFDKLEEMLGRQAARAV